MEKVDKPLNTNPNKVSSEKALCPHCGKNILVRYQQTPQMRILGLVDSDGVVASTRGNPDVETIYNFWNEQRIITHRSLTPDTAKSIRAILKEYTDSEVLQAIENYAEIQKGEQYWFDYAWTLKDFLKRGLPKFTDMEVARNNYLKREISTNTNPTHKWCRGCGYKAFTGETYCLKCGGTLEKDYTAGKYGHLIQQ